MDSKVGCSCDWPQLMLFDTINRGRVVVRSDCIVSVEAIGNGKVGTGKLNIVTTSGPPIGVSDPNFNMFALLCRKAIDMNCYT